MTMSNEWSDHEGELERRKKVGHYVLGPSLGEGNFAKVRIGTHVLSKEKVAVKIVSKRVIVRRDAARRNFRREALLLQHVRHPNIVRLYEAMETPNSYYLVFELAAYGSLLNYLTERKCLEEDECRDFMRQMVSALDHLHRSGLVHRDLKLENFLLNDNRHLKIVDFGLSAMCQRDGGLHTQCGSPMYAAPEIFGNRRYGPPVDIWSIGVCLYAMVVGRLPFIPDPPNNLPQLHALILKGPVIPTFLSASLQHLLIGLLEVQESRRMSINDVLNQSWLTCHRTQPIKRYPPVTQCPPLSIDTDVVRYMTAMLRFNESDVIHSLTERKLNASSATYHLLKDHMEREDALEGRGLATKPNEGDEFKHNGKSICFNNDTPVCESCLADSRKEETSESQFFPSVEPASANQNRFTQSGFPDEPVLQPQFCSKEELTTKPLPLMSPQEVTKHYKQCILYLKQSRHGKAHRRSLAGLSKDDAENEGKFENVSNSTRQSESRKLPLLNILRHSTNHQPQPQQQQQQHRQQIGPTFHVLQTVNSSSTTVNHQGKADATTRHLYVNPMHSQDFQLDVKGQPVLKDKGRSVTVGGEGGGGSEAAVKQAPSRLPPAPPNTAQGARSRQTYQTTSSASYSHFWESGTGFLSTPRPSSVESSEDSHSNVLRDPFGRDTWGSSAHIRPERLRLTGLYERRDERKAEGVAFVSPLSSPKALTSRGEVPAVKVKSQSYYLVRQLAAEINRKRNSPNHKKNRSVFHHSSSAPDNGNSHHFDQEDYIYDTTTTTTTNDDSKKHENMADGEGPVADSFSEKDSFLTPVIRVTITSTAKH